MLLTSVIYRNLYVSRIGSFAEVFSWTTDMAASTRDTTGDMSAAGYFDSLPLEVKEEINRRAADIHSISDLEVLATYLENKLES